MLKRGRECAAQTEGEPEKKAKAVVKQTSGLLALPAVCLVLIFSFLDLADNFLSLRRVCREFNQLAHLPTAFPPKLDTLAFFAAGPAPSSSLWVHSVNQNSRQSILTHLPKAYSPKEAIIHEIYDNRGILSTLGHLNTSKTETLCLNARDRYLLHVSNRQIGQFLDRSSASIKHFSSKSMADTSLMTLLSFLSGDKCKWRLRTLNLDAYLHKQDPVHQSIQTCLSSSPSLSTLETLHIPSFWMRNGLASIIGKHCPNLQDLCVCFDGSDLDKLFRAMPHLQTLRLKLRRDHFDNKQMELESVLLSTDPSFIPALTSLELQLHFEAILTWRTVAYLCSLPTFRSFVAFSILSPTQHDVKEELRDNELIAGCKPGLEVLKMTGMASRMAMDIVDKLPQLGQTLTNLAVTAAMDSNLRLFVQLGRHFRQLKNLELDTEPCDEGIEQLVTLTRLESLALVPQGVGLIEGRLTSRSIPAFFRMTALRILCLSVQSCLDGKEIRAQFDERNIELEMIS